MTHPESLYALLTVAWSVHTGSTTLVVTLYLRKASATTSIDSADANMPGTYQSRSY
jgi:hypothetical protein